MLRRIFFLLGTGLMIASVSAVQVSGLSPSEKVRECMDVKNRGLESNDCKKILCEWNNTAQNWPEHTGYSEDCSVYDSKISTSAPVAAISVLGIFATILLIRHLKRA